MIFKSTFNKIQIHPFNTTVFILDRMLLISPPPKKKTKRKKRGSASTALHNNWPHGLKCVQSLKMNSSFISEAYSLRDNFRFTTDTKFQSPDPNPIENLRRGLKKNVQRGMVQNPSCAVFHLTKHSRRSSRK